MLNVELQISYWLSCAKEDIETANILIEQRRFLHGLFFCHLVIEKALKAHVVKQTQELAPRSHNLYILAEKVGLNFKEKEELLLGILMKYQLQGRYPDYNPSVPDYNRAKEYYEQTNKLFQWLKMKL